MTVIDHDILEEVGDDRHSFAENEGAMTPVPSGVWLERRPLGSLQGAEARESAILAQAHALTPELERRRIGYEDALTDMRRLGPDKLFGAWRLSGRTYLALVGASAASMTAGAYSSLAALRPGWMSLLAAFGFTLNVTGIAHLAGGWGRKIQGLDSWLRRGTMALLAAAACAEILALVYVFGLGWRDATAFRLAAILAGAMLAVAASALRSHPNPDARRLLRRLRDARQDYEGVRKQILLEISAARKAFEEEAAVLEQAARPVPDAFTGKKP